MYKQCTNTATRYCENRDTLMKMSVFHRAEANFHTYKAITLHEFLSFTQ